MWRMQEWRDWFELYKCKTPCCNNTYTGVGHLEGVLHLL
jgi:hypothetical protein